MSTLDTQSTTVKTYAYLGDKVFIFSTGGVDIYQTSYISWTRLGYAALSNVTSGTVNANGIWLGTSDRGVWHCPIGNGDLTSQLQKYYATSGAGHVIQSDDINSLAGIDTKLLVCHSLGAEYFAAVGNPVQYSDEETDNAAINDTYIAYSVATGLETLALPSADWDSTDAIVLTTGSTPALSSDTVNDLRYGSGNSLFIAGSSGADVYIYEVVSGTELFTAPSIGTGWTDNANDTYTYDVSPAATDYLTVSGVLTATNSYRCTVTGTGFIGTNFGWSGGSFDGAEGDRFLTSSGSLDAPLVANGVDLRIFCNGTDVLVSDISCQLITTLASVTNIGTEAKYVWPSSTGTEAAGLMAYVDGNDDVIIYDISGASTLDTATGTFVACWVDDQADLTVRDAELEKFASIDYVSPASGNRDVRRDWDLYFEVIDTLDDITTAANVVVKVNGGTVTTTKTAITDGYKVEFSPVSSSGYRKTVTIDITVTDDNANVTNESYNFTTATATNTAAASTKAPSVIVYKDLSLSDAEDTYNSVKVNWLDETIEAYFVDEDQAKAAAQVEIEKGIYHKHNLSVRVYDTDESSNATQDIQEGDIITIDVDGLGLVNQKCEVLSKQRTTQFDRIEYNLNLAYYVLWT